MPNKTKEASHQKSNNTENEFRKLYTDPLNLFNNQQLYQQSIKTKQLHQLIEQNEMLNIKISCQEANLVDLQKKLDDKTEKLNEIKGKYDKLCQKHQQLMESLEVQIEEYSHLGVGYEKDRLQLNDQINRLNQNVSSLNAKEAECAAYVKAMRATLENSKMKNAEQELFKEKGKYFKDVGKFQKKIDKKNDCIRQLAGKLKNIETENKQLKNSLEIQENKINQRQRVPNRPVNTVSPMKATVNNNNQREIEHNADEIIPTVPISPIRSSRPVSPRATLDNFIGDFRSSRLNSLRSSRLNSLRATLVNNRDYILYRQVRSSRPNSPRGRGRPISPIRTSDDDYDDWGVTI